jgi:hypothetical protein
MAHSKPVSDVAKLAAKKALGASMDGDEPALLGHLRGLTVRELKELAVDSVVLHQYCMQLIRVRDLTGERPSVEEIAAAHPLA